MPIVINVMQIKIIYCFPTHNFLVDFFYMISYVRVPLSATILLTVSFVDSFFFRFKHLVFLRRRWLHCDEHLAAENKQTNSRVSRFREISSVEGNGSTVAYPEYFVGRCFSQISGTF